MNTSTTDGTSLALGVVTGDNPMCGLDPAVLSAYDANGNGVIDPVEHQAFEDAKRAEILAKYDTNGDGVLDAAERDALRADRRAARFAALDANGDGSLSADEVAAGCPLPQSFTQLDTNADGSISLEEFQSAQWPEPPHGGHRHGNMPGGHC